MLNVSFSHSHTNSGNTIAIKGLCSHASVKRPYSTEKNARVMPHPQHSVLRNRLNRHKLSPLYMPSKGMVYSNGGVSSRAMSLMVVLDRVAFGIGKVAYKNYDKVYKRPNAASSECEKL